jgi:LacI family transcriptional regulator
MVALATWDSGRPLTARARIKAHKRSRAPGIREIAKALGVSIGTVDRALHDRPGISAETRASVLRMVKALAYRPNLAARYLSSRKQLRIAVALPRQTAAFWNVVREGIEDAARPLEGTGVSVQYHLYPHLGEGEAEAIERALEEDIHGLVIAPGDPDKLKPLIRRADERGIAIVCVNTDAPGTARLTTVAVDPVTSGSLVGELMGRFVQGRGGIVLVTGLLATVDHARKLEGFRSAVGEMWPGLDIARVVEAHDDEGEAYGKCRDALAASSEVSGVYVSTANSIPVLRAIEDEGLGGQVTVITTDLFPALLPHIRSHRVAATIHQRPWTQGRIALQALHRYLAEGVPPLSIIGLPPHVVMRSNLKHFLQRVQSGWEKSLEGASPLCGPDGDGLSVRAG